MEFSSVLVPLFAWVALINCQTMPKMPCLKLTRDSRVVGGNNAVPGQTPYMASLTKRGAHFCGATIVNDRWLMTAGHCACSGVLEFLRPTQIKAVLGLYKISDWQHSATDQNEVDTSSQAYEVAVAKIIPHPGYDCAKPDNDIALLELEKTINFDNNVRPTCIAFADGDSSNRYEGASAFVSGWGWTTEDRNEGSKADTLQRAAVNVWKNGDCQESFKASNKPNVIAQTQLCAGKVTGGVDSCWADSGGPLVTEDNVLIGVVSTGVGCARPGLPGIYTRVSEYSGWIESVVTQ